MRTNIFPYTHVSNEKGGKQRNYSNTDDIPQSTQTGKNQHLAGFSSPRAIYRLANQIKSAHTVKSLKMQVAVDLLFTYPKNRLNHCVIERLLSSTRFSS